MKTLRNLFALALVMLCAMNVSAGKKVLLSANFDDGNIVFGGWGNGQTRDVVDGAFHVNNPSAVQSWESQIAYDFEEAFLPNNEYTLTMRIRGSAPGQISMGFMNADDNYKSVGEFGTIDFDVDWVDVRVTCLCNGEGGRRLIASIGQFEGDIYIDDFELAVYTESDEDETDDGSLDGYDVLVDSLAALVDKAIAWKAELNPNDEMHAQIIATLEQMIPVVQAVIENPESKESVEQMIADVQSALETYMPMIEQYDAKALAAVAVEAAQKLIATYLKYTDNAGLATAIAKVNEIISELGMWDTEYTIADLTAAVKALATAQEAFVAENAKSDMAVVKSWDFAAMADTMTVSDMYMTYSDETVKVGGAASNLGTGVWEGLAMQGANKFFIRTKTGGLWQGGGGGRKVGVLNMTAGSVITIVTDGECMSLADATVAEQTSMETVDGKTTYVYTMTADGTLALTMTRYFSIFLIEIAGRQANQEDESEKDDSSSEDDNLQDRISLQEVEFYSYDGWGPDAKKLEAVTPAWEMGAPSGLPYGDPSVNNGADLSAFSKMYVTVSPDNAGMRIMMNRKVQEGQCSDTEEASTLISIPSHEWCTQKYCTIEGNTYIIDLAQIKKDQGFVRLHAIKGASWDSQATIESIELEPAAVVKQVGWTEITTNGNLEGEDMSSFVAKIAPSADILAAPVVEGVGVDGSKGIQLTVPAKASETWASQFWIVLPQPLPEGTKYRVFFDAKANTEVAPETQAHRMPGDYIHYEMLGNPAITTEWQSFNYEGVISASQAGEGTFQSIAFNLSMLDSEIIYYFDNIRFEEYKNGVSAGFNDDVIKLDFGFDTNLPDLVKAAGKPRLMYPNDCVNVKVNGDEVTVLSVEGFADGRFYVFLEEALNGDDEVTMTFTNPADAAYHLVYNSSSEGDVKDFNGVAYHDSEVSSAEDVYSYIFVTPILIASEPETGSFNLPNNICEFKVTFDKNVDAEQLEAKLGNEILSIEPATGVAEKFILKRTSTDDLATGQYELNITNILPEIDIFEGGMAGDTTLILNVGKVNLDSSDTVRVILSDELFANAAANTIPMGYTVYFGTEVREGGSSQGSGSRMFDFAVGGDFTKGLYFREGHVEYGYVEGYELVFEAGKPYNIHFNTAMWKDNGAYMKFQIINELDEVVYEQLIKNNPNVNGSRDAIYNTTTVDVEFQAETTGYYFLKWWNSDANGNTGAVYCESLLANVSVKYVPNATGVEETQTLLTALANAKSVRDGNVDAKYEGAAFDALAAAIAKYEAEYETYTAPSAYYNAAVALDAAAKAVNDHRALCDTYYALPTQAQDILDKNADKKFAKTELYAQLAEVTSKYVTKNVTTETNPETGEVTEVVTLDVKKIIDDAELQAAIDELQGLVNTTAGLFTEGASKVTTTGIAALVERFRLAADALVALGVPADDELVVAAQNALDDDDDLADKIKNRMKLEIFGQLKNADNKLFEAVLDTIFLEFVTPTYDLTVFVKNPNLYATGITYNAAGQLQSGWAVPGWSTPDTLTAPDLITGWDAATYEISDCMFQTWNAPYAVEQTIIDLPAGVYTIVGSFGERQDESSAEGSFFYVQTSDTPSGEYAATVDAPVIGQSFPVDNIRIENIVVTDGYLTIGAVGGHASHTFFNQVKVYLTGAIEGYDYRMAYYELVGDTPMVVTPGDANGDGEVTIVDVVAVVNRLLGSNVGDFIFEAADMNQDGQISIVDVVAVVNVLLGKNVQAYGARSILRSDIHVADAEVQSGETTTLYVELDNAQAYTALQMDVELPEGLNIEGVEMVGNSSHAVTCNADGRIAAYSLNNSRFNGGKSLMGITVKADEGFAGTARVDFTNVRVVSMDVVETTLADAYSTVIGGATDIDDVLSDESVQVIYYTTDGIASDAPHKGLNIIKRIYGDGRVEVSKEMFE